MTIERVTEQDGLELLEIYGPYVQETASSVEYQVPTEEKFRKRIRSISAKDFSMVTFLSRISSSSINSHIRFFSFLHHIAISSNDISITQPLRNAIPLLHCIRR